MHVSIAPITTNVDAAGEELHQYTTLILLACT